MMSKMFTLSSNDAVKGIITAVVAAVVMALSSIVNQAGFDLFSVDWTEVFKVVLNASVAAFVGYMGKNFLTDSNGKFGGVL